MSGHRTAPGGATRSRVNRHRAGRMFTEREAAPPWRTGRFVAPTMENMQLHEAPAGSLGARALPGHHPDVVPAGGA